MLSTIPDWLIYVLGVVSGALLVFAIGPASEAFWDAVYFVRRACLIVGAVVLAGLLLGGAGWLLVAATTS